MERESTSDRRRWNGCVLKRRAAAVFTLLALAWAAPGCTGSTTQQTTDQAQSAERSHREDVVDALSSKLPQLLRSVAQERASQLTIDAILAAPDQHLDGVELRQIAYLRKLYDRQDHKPVWVTVDGTNSKLRPSAQLLLDTLREGVEAHGLWRDELHLDRLEMVDFDEQHRVDGRPFEDVTVDDQERQAILAWLAEREKNYDPENELEELTAALIEDGRPLASLRTPVEEQARRLRDVSESSSRIDVLFSDALVQYALRMRYENPAWFEGMKWPERLQKAGKGKEGKGKERKGKEGKGKEGKGKEGKEGKSAQKAGESSEPHLTGKELEQARREHLVLQALGPVFADSSKVSELLPELPPRFEPYERLTRAFKRYANIVKDGGWPKIPEQAEGLKRGSESEYIPIVKKRLRIEGYYDGDESAEFNNELRRALLKYQSTHQLWENGWLTPQTMRSLNDTAIERWNQIRLTMQRWRESRIGPDNHYVHVNIPDFHASVWKAGERKMYFKVVLGSTTKKKTDDGELVYKHATPRFSDTVEYIVFNPYWNVPEKIRKKELEPKFEENPEYFDEKGYEYHTDDNGHRFLRQKPGPNNALGRVKFLFPNPYAVYLHDTPQKQLFKHPFRAYSHGCVRIQNPMDFAHYLIDLDGRWSDEERRKEKLEEWFAKEGSTWLKLRQSLPIHIEYYVVRVDDEGHANFLADLYRLDRPRLKEIAEKVEKLETNRPKKDQPREVDPEKPKTAQSENVETEN